MFGDSSDPSAVQFLFYYPLAGVAITMTLVSCVAIVKYCNLSNTSSRLMFWLHLTLLIEEITSIPFIYFQVNGTCAIAGFVHNYAGLANGLVVGFLLIYYYTNYSNDAYFMKWCSYLSRFIERYGGYVIYGFSLITALPLTTNSYKNCYHVWCLIPRDNDKDVLWSIFSYQLWILIIVLIGTALVSRIMYAACKVKKHVGIRVLGSMGVYGVVALVFWSFRLSVGIRTFFVTSDSFSDTGAYFSQCLVMLTGIIYALALANDFAFIGKLSYYSHSENYELNWESIEQLIAEGVDTTNERLTSRASTGGAPPPNFFFSGTNNLEEHSSYSHSSPLRIGEA